MRRLSLLVAFLAALILPLAAPANVVPGVAGHLGVSAAAAAKPQCNDRRDNDGDGKIDFPADPGCTSKTDKDETDVVQPPPPPPPPPAACADGLDNDADGKIDYPADPGCASASDTDEADPAVGEPAPIAGQGYTLRFDDQFNTLNRAVWDDHIWYDDAPNPSWTGFQEVDANGILHLRSSPFYFWGPGPTDNYPINTMTTQTSGLTFTRGYFEARMKWLGGGHGAWPSFWLFSYRAATDPAYPSINPYCANNGLPRAECLSAELDVMDEGGAVSDLYVGLHRNSCNCFGEGNVLRPSENWFPQGMDLSADWHTYSVKWTTSEVTWYIDDRLVASVAPFDSTNQPMFMLLQNWTNNGCWDCGATNGSVTDTQVDYVRVWQQ